MEYEKVRLETINKGAAQELFAESFKKVMDNIHDLSTPAEGKRTITLKFEIIPTKDRQSAVTSVECALKLPQIMAHESAIYFSSHGNKHEAFVHNVSQGNLFEVPKKTAPVEEETPE